MLARRVSSSSATLLRNLSQIARFPILLQRPRSDTLTTLKQETCPLFKLRSPPRHMSGLMAPQPVQAFEDVCVLWDTGTQVSQILSSRLRDDIKQDKIGDVQTSG